MDQDLTEAKRYWKHMRDKAQEVFDAQNASVAGDYKDEKDLEDLRVAYENSLLCVDEYTTKEFIFGTGGPHYSVEIKLDKNGDVVSGKYIFKDWNTYYSKSMTAEELDVFCSVTYIED